MRFAGVQLRQLKLTAGLLHQQWEIIAALKEYHTLTDPSLSRCDLNDADVLHLLGCSPPSPSPFPELLSSSLDDNPALHRFPIRIRLASLTSLSICGTSHNVVSALPTLASFPALTQLDLRGTSIPLDLLLCAMYRTVELLVDDSPLCFTAATYLRGELLNPVNAANIFKKLQLLYLPCL